MTKTPIRAKDMQEGDLIRREHIGTESAIEFRANSARASVWDETSFAYFLLDRPIVLPTVPGWYKDKVGAAWKFDAFSEYWYLNGLLETKEYAKSRAPFTRLMTEVEWEAGR